MPFSLMVLIAADVNASRDFRIFLGNLATRGRGCVFRLLMSGKIVNTTVRTRRRHGGAAWRRSRSEGGRAGGHAVPEPAPGAGDRPGVPGQRVLRRPGRGAG